MYKVTFNKQINVYQVINLMFGVVGNFTTRQEANQYKKRISG